MPLGAQVLRMACEEALRWQMPDSRPLPVAVNVSGRQLRDSSLLDTITRVLAETGLASGLLEIELTETATLGEGGSSENLLHELHETGIGIALDDFGTGDSSRCSSTCAASAHSVGSSRSTATSSTACRPTGAVPRSSAPRLDWPNRWD